MNIPWQNYNVIDISRKIEQGMPVYPNNPSVIVEEIPGDTSTISKLQLGTHTGTHLDTPRHVFDTGLGVEDIQLNTLMGPCKVVDLSQETTAITKQALQTHSIQAGERVLFKTTNSSDPFEEFNPEFVYLDGDAADFLAECDVSLVGVDYLSVKQFGGKDYRAHDALLIKNIVILEGLDLSQAEEGSYILVALPLPLGAVDGAPVRAVLLQ